MLGGTAGEEDRFEPRQFSLVVGVWLSAEGVSPHAEPRGPVVVSPDFLDVEMSQGVSRQQSVLLVAAAFGLRERSQQQPLTIFTRLHVVCARGEQARLRRVLVIEVVENPHQ